MKRTKENPTRFNVARYKEIKNMDQEQMKSAVNAYYLQGYEKGAATAGLDVEKALERIGQIKGIGSEKMEQIKQALIDSGGAYGNETE